MGDRIWLRWCWGRVGGRLGTGSGRVGWCYVCVCCESMCRWKVQVSVYCARRSPVHLRCTQCSILLHHIDICFLTCICMRHISQIQTCLRVVVGPGLVSTSPAFIRSIASHPAGPHGRFVQKKVIGPPLLGAGGVDTICTRLARRCDSSTL